MKLFILGARLKALIRGKGNYHPLMRCNYLKKFRIIQLSMNYFSKMGRRDAGSRVRPNKAWGHVGGPCTEAHLALGSKTKVTQGIGPMFRLQYNGIDFHSPFILKKT